MTEKQNSFYQKIADLYNLPYIEWMGEELEKTCNTIANIRLEYKNKFNLFKVSKRISFQDLKRKWIWKSYSENKEFWAQCVAWAKKAINDLYGISLASFWGSALNAWQTWSPFSSEWKKVENKIWNYPSVWAVVFFDKVKWNPYWHVAIVGEGSDKNKLVVLEQNAGNWNGDWVGNNAITERILDYIHPAKCLGWYELKK